MPFDDWLQRNGDRAIATKNEAARLFDGAFEGAAAWWRTSWLGSALRGRIERVAEHHEKKEQESERT